MSSSDVLIYQELCAYVLTHLLATLFDQNVTVVCHRIALRKRYDLGKELGEIVEFQ